MKCLGVLGEQQMQSPEVGLFLGPLGLGVQLLPCHWLLRGSPQAPSSSTCPLNFHWVFWSFLSPRATLPVRVPSPSPKLSLEVFRGHRCPSGLVSAALGEACGQLGALTPQGQKVIEGKTGGVAWALISPLPKTKRPAQP